VIVLAGLLAPSVAGAQAWGPGRLSGPFQPPDPSDAWERDLAEASGLLIVNGHEVPLPCRIWLDGDDLKINDQKITSKLSFGGDEQEDGQGNGGGKFRRGRQGARPARSTAISVGNSIVQSIASGYLVIAQADEPLVILTDSKAQYELLRVLVGDQRPRVTPASMNSYLLPGADHTAWNKWLESFAPSAEFRQHAGAKIEQYDRVEAEAQTAIAATHRLYTFSYPLSLLGMVVTTLGIGHLLSHRPPVDAKSLETDASPLALKVLNYSLVLVVIYSAIDLTWTILAYQAGQMIELNPLGSQLMDSPLKLIAFKGTATGLAVGVLFVLRKYRKAQLAAWWVCLVCTLLTARWLTMSHMFAA
jgi:hypothetical protein